jgi:hypothetical protein
MSEECEDKNLGVKLTPFGCLVTEGQKLGVPACVAEELWLRLEGFCMRRLRDEDPEANFAGVVFDGFGGTVLGVEDLSDGN